MDEGIETKLAEFMAQREEVIGLLLTKREHLKEELAKVDANLKKLGHKTRKPGSNGARRRRMIRQSGEQTDARSALLASSDDQRLLLDFLKAEPESGWSVITSELGWTRQKVTQNAQALISLGLLKIHSHDGNGALYVVTTEGMEALEEDDPPADDEGDEGGGRFELLAITPDQKAMLGIIVDEPGSTREEVCEALGWTSQKCGANGRKLQGESLITVKRVAGEPVYTPTEKAKRAAEEEE